MIHAPIAGISIPSDGPSVEAGGRTFGALMAIKAKKHLIDDFTGALVSCRCGWHYRESRPADFAKKSLADHLLDKYNEHRERVSAGGAHDA